MTSSTSPALDARALHGGLDRCLAEVVRRGVGEGAVEGADGGAGRAHDHDVGVGHDAMLRTGAAGPPRGVLLSQRSSRGRPGSQLEGMAESTGPGIQQPLRLLFSPATRRPKLSPSVPEHARRRLRQRIAMATEKAPTTIKKYANRRLYHTGTSTYVTLEDLSRMVRAGDDFVVYDAKTGEDITRSVLGQIIFEQENKEGQNLCRRLPAPAHPLLRRQPAGARAALPRILDGAPDPRPAETARADEQDLWARRLPCGRGPGARQHGVLHRGDAALLALQGSGGGQAGVTTEAEGQSAAELDALKRQMAEMARSSTSCRANSAQAASTSGRPGISTRTGGPQWSPCRQSTPHSASRRAASSSPTHSATVLTPRWRARIDQGAHQEAVVGRAGEVLDERTVDLEQVDR
jgi:hypothetical protein